eukprot:8958030-Pyramimonas_sp.AAC.2
MHVKCVITWSSIKVGGHGRRKGKTTNTSPDDDSADGAVVPVEGARVSRGPAQCGPDLRALLPAPRLPRRCAYYINTSPIRSRH